ncbi:MAG: hypothetical protein IPF42_19890 [Candidatus Microthrix sp.]|nr:hypothetical protein [Candidatus Microthrix sp.]
MAAPSCWEPSCGRLPYRVPLFALPAFAVTLAAFAFTHDPVAAHFIVFALGFCLLLPW